MRNITIIGAGIIGASIAWHLVKAGARVKLVADRPGGIATPTSFAWINASWGNPEPYFRLRTRSMLEWRQMAREIPVLPLTWGGGLCWDLPPAELGQFADQHGGWGYDIRRVSAQEASRIEPNVSQFPKFALHVRQEGAADPATATHAIIDNARRKGLELIETTVTGLREKSGRVTAIVTSDGEIATDEVVLAAGANVPALAATVAVAVPIEAPPGLIVHSRPVPKLLNGLVLATELHVRQTGEGRIVAGSDFAGTDPGSDPEGAAQMLFERLRAFLKGGDRLEMDFHTVGYRPTPIDGLPIIGRADGVEGLYLAVTHSGITLAPVIGRFAVDEILNNNPEPLLAPYRLSRFA